MTLVSPKFFIVGLRSDLSDPISRDLADQPGDQVDFLSVSDLGSVCQDMDLCEHCQEKVNQGIAYQYLSHGPSAHVTALLCFYL